MRVDRSTICNFLSLPSAADLTSIVFSAWGTWELDYPYTDSRSLPIFLCLIPSLFFSTKWKATKLCLLWMSYILYSWLSLGSIAYSVYLTGAELSNSLLFCRKMSLQTPEMIFISQPSHCSKLPDLQTCTATSEEIYILAYWGSIYSMQEARLLSPPLWLSCFYRLSISYFASAAPQRPPFCTAHLVLHSTLLAALPFRSEALDLQEFDCSFLAPATSMTSRFLRYLELHLCWFCHSEAPWQLSL